MFTRNQDCSAGSSCSPAAATTKQTLLFLLFTLFWSSLMLLGDSFVVYRAEKQLRSNGFPSAKGQITKSATVKTGSGMGGTNYGVDVAYDFTVDGKAYTGHQFRYGSGEGSNDGYASRVVQSLPAGQKVDVFYNPTDPKDCILSPGLDGGDLFLAMFMMPFNLFMLCLWAGLPHLLRSIFTRRQSERTSEPSNSDDLSPMTSALAVLAAASFLMTFVIGIPMGFHPSMLAMEIVWLILISSTVITYLLVRRSKTDSRCHTDGTHE